MKLWRLGSRKRTWPIYLFLWGLAAAIFIEVVAGTYHGWLPAAPNFFITDGSLAGFTLQPNVNVVYLHNGEKTKVVIGHDGRRSVEPHVSAPLGIWVVGDSQVFGWGLSNGETLCDKLQQLVGQRATVHNCGLPGVGPYKYVEIVRSLPLSDIVVICITMENDLNDLYSPRTLMVSAGGYLTRESSLVASLPEPLLRLHSVTLAANFWNEHFRYELPLPLAYSPYAEIAAKLHRNRLAALIDGLRSEPLRRIYSTTVPWVGAVRSDTLQLEYSPHPSVGGQCYTEIIDSAKTTQKFIDNRSTSLFQRADGHLSAQGARLMADHIFSLLAQDL